MTTTARDTCPACGQSTEHGSPSDFLDIWVGDGVRYYDQLYHAMNADTPTGSIRDVKIHFRCLAPHKERLAEHDRISLLEWHIERLDSELGQAQEKIRSLQNEQT